MGIRDWFRPREVEEAEFPTASEIRQELAEQAMMKAMQAVDLMNEAIPFLPRDIKPWMLWRPNPRLVLRRYDFDDAEIIYGNGDPRV